MYIITCRGEQHYEQINYFTSMRHYEIVIL